MDLRTAKELYDILNRLSIQAFDIVFDNDINKAKKDVNKETMGTNMDQYLQCLLVKCLFDRKSLTDEYFDIINRVKEALIADRQKEIDKLTEINDSINDTNSKIISNMQKQIEQQRQQKENQKTEDSIQDKIYQLEYLKQDSSGANAIAILELEEQIKQEQEDHLANLVDQGIQNLQEQKDQAYEQRQTQIDIMQQQLDHWAQSEEIWNEVHSIIDEGFDEATGKIIEGSTLQTLLSNETTGMS